jgi:hypothetical protein
LSHVRHDKCPDGLPVKGARHKSAPLFSCPQNFSLYKPTQFFKKFLITSNIEEFQRQDVLVVIPGDFFEINASADRHFVFVAETSVNVTVDDGRFSGVLIANDQQFVILSLCQ